MLFTIKAFLISGGRTDVKQYTYIYVCIHMYVYIYTHAAAPLHMSKLSQSTVSVIIVL